MSNKAKIEQFRNDVNELMALREDLHRKDSTKPEKQKEKEELELEEKFNAIENEINEEIKNTSDEKTKEELKAILDQAKEARNLRTNIESSNKSKAQSKKDKESEKKWFSNEIKSWFGEKRDRLGESWNSFKSWFWENWDCVISLDKWNEEPWNNAARLLCPLTIVWIPLAFRLYNRKKKKKQQQESQKSSNDKQEKKTSWRKKTLAFLWIWAWIWAASYIWYQWYKHPDKIGEIWNKIKEFWWGTWDKVKWFWWVVFDKIKWFFEKNERPLEFSEAIESATSEVRNWTIDENPFRQHFKDGITYDEWNGVIKSYWQETKVDVNKKTIEWDSGKIEFPDYKQLIHAANIINFTRRNFAGRCQNDMPFEISDWWWWDLVVHLANWEKPEWISASDSTLWTKILWVWWCVIWTVLWAYIWNVKWALWLWVTLWIWWAAAWNYLDEDSSMNSTVPTADSWVNLDRFRVCLNSQKNSKWESLWPKKSHQDLKPDDVSPIEKELNAVIRDIEWSWWEWTWWRELTVEQSKENPEVFTITSYWDQHVDIIIEWCTQTWNERIDYSKVTSIKIWKYQDKDRWDWLDIAFSNNEDWLKECIRTANLTNKIRNDYAWEWGEDYPFAYWRYNAPFNLDIDTNGRLWTTVVSHKTLVEKYPTIYKDLGKYPYVRWVVWV